MSPFWLSAFLDHAPEHHADGVAFWAAVTGYALSSARGEAAEFATLVPPTGDDFLRAQRVVEGPGGQHLDLHVDDPRAAADAAVAIGAREITDVGHVVLASPAGQVFCFVSHRAARVPAPVAHEGGAARVVQVALDVPPAQHEAEVLFWQTLTGWERRASTIDEAFTFLVPPAGAAMPLRLLVQRLGDADAVPGAHLDWGSTDRPATVAHHVALGARVLAVHPLWTVLADPVGRVYCVTDQRPS